MKGQIWRLAAAPNALLHAATSLAESAVGWMPTLGAGCVKDL
jgi:hypothetical protein